MAAEQEHEVLAGRRDYAAGESLNQRDANRAAFQRTTRSAVECRRHAIADAAATNDVYTSDAAADEHDVGREFDRASQAGRDHCFGRRAVAWKHRAAKDRQPKKAVTTANLASR